MQEKFHHNHLGEVVATSIRENEDAPFLIICEHASSFIPQEFNGLGLCEVARNSHIAFDPGALEVAKQVSAQLNAPLFAASNSRLVYDLNRPPDQESAIPSESEIYKIPGNQNLSFSDWDVRVQRFYVPFVELLQNQIAKRERLRAIITIHSFTRTYFGHSREVEVGLLHDADDTLAHHAFSQIGGCFGKDMRPKVELNEPYSARDGVTHSLQIYAGANGLASLMIEIRNDLIANTDNVELYASALAKSVGNFQAAKPAR